MTFKALITFVLLSSTTYSFSQVEITGEFRPRTEYRNGFNTLKKANESVGFGTALRSRINFKFKNEDFETYLSIQDVSVFGENRPLKTEDSNNSFALFEAWAKIGITNGLSTKIGRQIIAYDNERILGAARWAQQGRTHDAFLLQHNSEKLKIDLGLAYNQDHGNPSGFQSTGNYFSTTGAFSYKTMQYLWLNKQFNTSKISLLVLNNGFQEQNESSAIYNLTTYGTYFESNIEKFKLTLHAYGQSGKNPLGTKISKAYVWNVEGNYKTSDKTSWGLGMEVLSGKDSNTAENTAFSPLYGSNHRHNGLLDYFYVGNHINTIGLKDIHISTQYDINHKTTLSAKGLYFTADKKLPSGDQFLGTEIDLVLTHQWKPSIAIKSGYSQLFASKGMEELKNNNSPQKTQNWAWIMLTLKPKFL